MYSNSIEPVDFDTEGHYIDWFLEDDSSNQQELMAVLKAEAQNSRDYAALKKDLDKKYLKWKQNKEAEKFDFIRESANLNQIRSASRNDLINMLCGIIWEDQMLIVRLKVKLQTTNQEKSKIISSIGNAAGFRGLAWHLMPTELSHLQRIENAFRAKKAQDKALPEGRKRANTRRNTIASKNSVIINKAVHDYLARAARDGLNQSNHAVIRYIKNQTQLQQNLKTPNGKPYKDSSFERMIKLGAAKWRNQRKQAI